MSRALSSKAVRCLQLATGTVVLAAGTLSAGAATIVWDNGGGDGLWVTGANWYNETTATDTNTLPGSGDVAKFDGAAPATINVGATRTVNTIEFGAGQTTNVKLDTNRVEAFTVAVRSGAGAVTHTITRWQLRGTMTANIEGADQRFIANAMESGFNTLNKQGAGALQVDNWINAHQRSNISVTGGTLDIRSTMNFDSSNPGNNSNTGALLSGASGTSLTNGGVSAVTWVFGRKGAGTADFAGNISGLANLQLGARDTHWGNNTDGRTNFDGVQTLSGANTYTGTTTVRQGTLLITGTHTGGGNYVVTGTTSSTQANSQAKMGTLGGTGSIGLKSGGSFTVGDSAQLANSRGVLRPGLGDGDTGNLTIGTDGHGNSVNFLEKSTLKLDVGNTGFSDRVTIIGDLNLSATDDVLDLAQIAGSSMSFTYTLASFTGTLTGEFGSVYYDGVLDSDPTVELASTGYKLAYNANSISLVPIPEPTSLALLGGLAAVPMLRRRRR